MLTGIGHTHYWQGPGGPPPVAIAGATLPYMGVQIGSIMVLLFSATFMR